MPEHCAPETGLSIGSGLLAARHGARFGNPDDRQDASDRAKTLSSTDGHADRPAAERVAQAQFFAPVDGVSPIVHSGIDASIIQRKQLFQQQKIGKFGLPSNQHALPRHTPRHHQGGMSGRALTVANGA